MPKIIRANPRRRVDTAANLTDEQIKQRNEKAHQAFLAARRAAKRGYDQSKTNIRVDEKGTRITGKKGEDKSPAQEARNEQKRSDGVSYSESAETAKRTGKKTTGRARGSGYSSHVGADPYGSNARSVSGKRSVTGKKTKKVKKSLDEIQGFIQGMLQVAKREEGFKTRVTGVNLGTKIRNKPQEGKIRDKPQEVQTGPNYNLQTRIGDPAEKAIIAKSELNSAFNGLLDAYQSRWFNKNIFDEARANPKKPHLKGERSAKKTPQGSDKETPAIGSTTEDQKVMTS